MSEKQPGAYRPKEYYPAKVSGRIGRAAVRAAVRAAEIAANYLNSAAETGRDYIGEHTGADAGKPTSEESETLATSTSNTSSEKQASDANKPEADDDEDGIPAFLRRRKNAGGDTKSTSGKQTPGTDEAKNTNSKANTPDTSVDTSGKNAGGDTKSTSGKQTPGTDEAKNTNSKANTPDTSVDTSGKNAGGDTKSTSGKQTPDAAADFMRKFLDESKQDQDQVSPEKREAADELEKAKDRHSKASAAAESKNPLGKKRRQAELKAATEQLKKCELLDKAADKLDEDRKIYAETSAAFETYLFKGKKRQAELEAAAEQLKQSELGYMSIKFADKIEAAKQDPEKQAELAAEMAQAAFASMQETSRVTTDKYDSMLDDRNIVKKAAAKVGKWFNKGGRIAQLLKLGGTGFAVGATTATFAGWPITTAVGIVTELGVAGATKQAVLEERRGEDRIDDDSLEAIDPSFKDTVANMKIDDVMKHAVNVSIDNLKDVSIERQDALRKKVRSSLGKYGAGFALGGFAGKFAGDWANSAHATGAESNTTTPPQSGSGQIPQQPSGASSMDNSIAKTIVNNINPDTSNFNSYDYPWDWAAEKFGDANAMDQLHNLADKAMANGHTVEWFNNPDGSVWMKVDGSSATKHVLDVLSRYV